MQNPWRSLVFTAVLAGLAPAATQVDAQATAPNFKVAFFNIQSGKGEPAMPGHPSTFSDTLNCTDTTQPLNAWGRGVVQATLTDAVASDPTVVALGLAEAWSCATQTAVRNVLGWRAASTARNGVAMVARYGFAGAEQWTQLDTSLNTNPADTMWALRVPVCLDAACSRSISLSTAHWYGSGATHYNSNTAFEIQAQQTIDFLNQLPAGQPRVLVGDLNVFEGTKVVCGQNPKNQPVQMMREAGYLDAWRALFGLANGDTGMWNRAGCGTPVGNLWKRIDYAWTRDLNPLSMTRFGMVNPGDEAPSDHIGIIVEFADPQWTAASLAPTANIRTPVEGAIVKGSVPISVDAQDDQAVTRLELLMDGVPLIVSSRGPFDFVWDTSRTRNGRHELQAAASDAAGNRALSTIRTVDVENSVAPGDEIVLYAADATGIVGNWQLVDDSTAAAGKRLQNADTGGPKIPTSAAASPSSYFEMSFTATAGKAYRLWIRGKAFDNSTLNDDVYVQFSGSVDASGVAVTRIGTTKTTAVNLEDCDGCGLSGWGWQDNGWPRDVLGPLVYFATSGTQKLRVQPAEDGLGIDQIVLSSLQYLEQPPGRLKDDATILPKTGESTPSPPGNTPPTVTLTKPSAGSSFAAPAAVQIAANASDPDGGIARVDFYVGSTLIGASTTSPYGVTWNATTAGTYTLTARATDTAGAATTSAAVTVQITAAPPPPPGSNDEIVLYAASAPVVAGNWSVVADASAAGGSRLQSMNAGAAKLTQALAAPADYFELTFTADAGKPYRLWLRAIAQNNNFSNDSIFVQFDGSANAAGAATDRIGTTVAEVVNLEDCSGCGLQGWGWQDNGYGVNVLGPVIYFAQTGTQRLRIQIREDGVGIDQVVLSAVRYMNQAPGALKNDTTILPATGGDMPSADSEVVLYAASAPVVSGNWGVVADASAAGGSRLQSTNAGAAKLTQALAAPANYFELTFTADAGKPYRLWLRAIAQSNSFSNDSVFVQFDGSTNAAGAAIDRIGTTAAEVINLEDCSGCGLQGWGWQDNGYGANVLGPVVYFAQTGPQRLRIQIREDGVGIDQVVLSAVRYMNQAPGALKNDTTILPAK